MTATMTHTMTQKLEENEKKDVKHQEWFYKKNIDSYHFICIEHWSSKNALPGIYNTYSHFI